jgi:phage tail sheath protein FI
MYVTRMVDDSATNSCIGAVNSAAKTPLIKNLSDFDTQKSALAVDGNTFIGRFPGTAGNSLNVAYIGSCAETDFTSWAYADLFDAKPASSAHALNLGGSNDEVHVAVIDEGGTFSGTKGTVLETFPFVSQASDAKTSDGSSNFIEDVINSKSEYVYCVDLDAGYTNHSSASSTNFGSTHTAVNTPLVGGIDSKALGTAEMEIGYGMYADENSYDVDFIIAPGMTNNTDQAEVVNRIVSMIAGGDGRKDCVAVASPSRSAVVNVAASSVVEKTLISVNLFTSSSYLVVDNNYLKVYDKYNDQYIMVPAASSTAGIMAATDINAAPWFSPAGQRRGQYFGVTSLAYNPSKIQRDQLYKAGINPIVNLPGQGILLFGDKTKESSPSAFDRINVRRLFLVIEKAIKRASSGVMFEFNDEFTRSEFVNIVEPFLREIKGRRGITDFSVVCDATNNTANVIDTNNFVASIFVKPARSINFVTLNFVATRTGVEFEEIVGTV